MEGGKSKAGRPVGRPHAGLQGWFAKSTQKSYRKRTETWEMERDVGEEIAFQDEFGFRRGKSELMVVPPGSAMKLFELTEWDPGEGKGTSNSLCHS